MIDFFKNLFLNSGYYIILSVCFCILCIWFCSRDKKACSEEYELVRDYNGRQILELLQNVDDACDETEKHTNKSKNVVVKIVFNNNLLEVGNTGTSLKSSRHFASTGRLNSRSVVGLLN